MCGAGVVRTRLPDGSEVTVGAWDYDDVADHVWAVGIEERLLDATEMRIVDESGTVLATATLE